MSLPLGASRRLSTTNATPDDDGLTQSLSQLSLTNQPSVNKSPRPKPASVPLHPSSRRSSASTSACPEQPPQSPSSAQLSRVTPHVASPPLLRKTSTSSLQSTSSVGTARPASRRSSLANVWSPSSSSSQLGKPPQKEEKPAVTANSVARDYFKSELEVHHGPTPTRHTKTIVILNDAVYGHRFSRPRTSRNALSTIVERPERIKACVMGISMAYVRLGGRHSEGPFPIQPTRDVGSLPSVPFRIRKTTNRLPLTSPAVTNVHGTKWMNELKDMCLSAESKLAMGGKELKRTRGSDDGPGQKLHEGDLYLCSESLEAIEGALGSVCEAVNTVFTTPFRRAFVGVRPPGHHCSASQPSGFCWVNNVHVGIMHGILTHGLTHAAIIDFDLHHGDGSQAITWQHNARATAAAKNSSAWKKTSIGYFSLHDINSYPCEMGDEEKVKNASLCIDNAHGQSVWNVHLHSWKSEKDFWVLYETRYKMLLEKTRVYLRNQADRLKALNQPAKAAIFFSAGFDASEWESAGMQRHQVNVPTEFYARLSQDVVKLAAEEGLHVDGRVISVLEGGYSDRALSSGIFSHLSGLVESQTAADVQTEADESPASVHSYDRSWWSSAALDKLEQPFVPPSPPRKARSALSTFSSPTQAATAKAADPARMRRTLSGVSTLTVIERPTSPTPPDVPWVVATQELCKLLIPTDRQTDSCKAEELNAEASKARRDRQSILMGIPPPAEQSSRPTSRMALRERRAKATGPVNEEGNGNIKTRRKNAEMDMFASPEKRSQPPSVRLELKSSKREQDDGQEAPVSSGNSQGSRVSRKES
ncbi:hypothetical protein RJ55_04132 [Drechmeria coniospora]|nr:hypothetical protein RJ55_04132 [Drechmeria coniospora]